MRIYFFCRACLVVVVLLLSVPAYAGSVLNSPPNSAPALAPIAVLKLEGAISPVLADYATRGIAHAARDGAQLIVISIDTPGGLDTAMRDIIKAILASSIPVAAFVWPGGARAASAGTFILYASHIAAMAPGTNLGAATPVAIGGAAPDSDAGHQKAVNDAAAYISSLARLRKRNAEWAEQAVRQAVSLPAEEAQRQKVIDLVAVDMPDLLRQLDRRDITLAGQSRTLQLAGAALRFYPPDWRVRLLAVITDPGIALLLIMVGIVGLFIELTHPGLILPGVLGAICLLLGMYALQLLPVNFAGLALIVLGLGCMIAEAFLPSYGVLGIGGIVAFVIGAVMLMNTELPGYGVPLEVIVLAAITSAALFVALGGLAVKSWQRTAVTGDAVLIGAIGDVIENAPGNCWALVQGERWRIISNDNLRRGQKIRVTARHGLVLEVEMINQQSQGESHDRL